MSNDNEAKFHNVRINLAATRRNNTKGTVYIDGMEIKNVKSITIESSYDSTTEVTMTLFANVTADIDGAKVT